MCDIDVGLVLNWSYLFDIFDRLDKYEYRFCGFSENDWFHSSYDYVG